MCEMQGRNVVATALHADDDDGNDDDDDYDEGEEGE